MLASPVDHGVIESDATRCLLLRTYKNQEDGGWTDQTLGRVTCFSCLAQIDACVPETMSWARSMPNPLPKCTTEILGKCGCTYRCWSYSIRKFLQIKINKLQFLLLVANCSFASRVS